MNKIGILAGDLRQHYIASSLSQAGYSTEYLYNFDCCPAYVVPVPFTKDGVTLNSMLKDELSIDDFIFSQKEGNVIYGGNIPKVVVEKLNKIGVICHDFLEDSSVVWENAYLTAEGLLSYIIEATPFSLKDKNIFIIGYGKCGSLTAKLLAPLCNNIFIYDHTPKHLHELKANGFIPLEYENIITHFQDFHVVINTVPAKELNESHYAIANKDCFFFEIASKPFGLDSDIIEAHNLHLITCPGIPGKISPEAAGEIISNNIIEHLERNDKDES